MGQKDRFNLLGHTIASTFRVDEVVAEGGFGLVYKAYHLHFRSPIALKCLKIPGELSDAERGDFLEQFRSEAEIMFRLSSSLANIVRPLHVDAVNSDNGEFVPLMALEWLDGKSFEEIIEERAEKDQPAYSLSELLELLTPVAYALDQAHCFDGGQLAIVHRDIKPDNLFLTQKGNEQIVKILDFGISKVRRAATQLAGHYSQTSGSAPFSPAYGAPEQWVPKRYGQTGPWTDVWGLALTMCEILKNDAVIVGDHQAMMGTALDPKVRPTPRNEGVLVSDEVEGVFEKALSVDPRYRYQTIREFWEALLEAHARDGFSSNEHAQVNSPSGGYQRHSSAPTHFGALSSPGGDSAHQPQRARTSGAGNAPAGAEPSLPRMRQPTPWNAPELRKASEPAPIAHLPAMLAPAPLELSQPLVEPIASLGEHELFPHEPSSCEVVREFEEAERSSSAPPTDVHSSQRSQVRLHRWITKEPPFPTGESFAPDEERTRTGRRPTEPPLARRGGELSPQMAPPPPDETLLPLDLELAPNSVVPGAPSESPPPPEIAAAPPLKCPQPGEAFAESQVEELSADELEEANESERRSSGQFASAGTRRSQPPLPPSHKKRGAGV